MGAHLAITVKAASTFGGPLPAAADLTAQAAAVGGCMVICARFKGGVKGSQLGLRLTLGWSGMAVLAAGGVPSLTQ